MTSTSETGHAKNVANFDELISYVTAYGTAYNPSKSTISLAALQSLAGSAKSAIVALNTVLPPYSNAVAAREVAFEPLSKLATRVMNAVKATDTTVQVDESVKTLVRKIQGGRASTKKTEEEKAALAAEGTEAKEISSSQMSYDSRLDNFDKLIKLLGSITLYAPNETDLKVSSLLNIYNDLVVKNAAVIATATPLSNARIQRNKILYKPDSGLVDIAFDSKTYIKSLYGPKSAQYGQVSKLAFKAVVL